MISRLGVVGTMGFVAAILAVLVFGRSGRMPPS